MYQPAATGQNEMLDSINNLIREYITLVLVNCIHPQNIGRKRK